MHAGPRSEQVMNSGQHHGLPVVCLGRQPGNDDGIRARSCQPPLTAVDLHLDDMASQAVALLFDHLGGGTDARRCVVPALPKLVIRESSG